MSAPTGHVPYHDAAQRVGDSYFTDFRKGEVNELMEMLRQAHNDKTGVKLVDTVKRVVAYMTLGIDVSRLFSQMVMVP
jgi:vesicle coat complex subunit